MSEIEELNSLSKDICRNEAWPDELLEQYEKLSLPSLYDFLVSQEKLSAEIRKQNKELKAANDIIRGLSEKIESLQTALDAMRLPFDPDGDEEGYGFVDHEPSDGKWSDDDERRLKAELADEKVTHPEVLRADQTLMLTMDGLLSLLAGLEACQEKILTEVPTRSSFWNAQKPAWRERLENNLKGYVVGVEAVKQKLLIHMADHGLQQIYPPLGSAFDPTTCRALQKVQGDPKGCIAEVLRCGYCAGEKLLRPADVTIYQ